MSELKEFIEVTSLYDRKKALIRTACIEAVYDNAESKSGCGIKFPHREIIFSGQSLEVCESMDEIRGMIFKSEL